MERRGGAVRAAVTGSIRSGGARQGCIGGATKAPGKHQGHQRHQPPLQCIAFVLGDVFAIGGGNAAQEAVACVRSLPEDDGPSPRGRPGFVGSKPILGGSRLEVLPERARAQVGGVRPQFEATHEARHGHPLELNGADLWIRAMQFARLEGAASGVGFTGCLWRPAPVDPGEAAVLQNQWREHVHTRRTVMGTVVEVEGLVIPPSAHQRGHSTIKVLRGGLGKGVSLLAWNKRPGRGSPRLGHTGRERGFLQAAIPLPQAEAQREQRQSETHPARRAKSLWCLCRRDSH